ncbi:gamma-tubulin complex component [Plasmodium brasilianum]|uniref:Gamma-tubulin complex component n=1 Tax=Plasmodium brasilianum TaxID=5824 RepID=A0ACB9Y5F5_PLABR|nr:gamma-tubulin complex component [Plasmodium brasilianum]
MIHEIIVSLIGQTGDIIILVDKKREKTTNGSNINIDEYGFEVNNNIHIFLNSEIKIINEIVELGYYFYIINIFCLLVKKNTIYKDLTHIHKFNKLNAEKKRKKKRKKKRDDCMNENLQGDDNSSSYASSSSFSSSSDESSSYDEESEDSNNLSNSYKKRKFEKKNEINNYFGVILKNIKSLNNASPYGYYANGLCNEINKFMRRYLKTISEIEEYINNNSNTPLTQILTMLEKKREEIIIIINIIKNYLEFQRKEEQNIVEGESRNKTKEILDFLYEKCLSGNSRIKNIYHKYFKNLGKILLHQIFSWILYGQLLDPYCEFFIQKRQFIYSDDKKVFLSPEELYENLTLTNVQSLNFEWNYLFFQSLSNLPDCCIDKITGRKILFIGKSIRILIRSNKWNTSDIIKLFSITQILSKAFDQTSRRGYKKRGDYYYIDTTAVSYENDISSQSRMNNVRSVNNINNTIKENDVKIANGINTITNDYVPPFSISSSSDSDSSYEHSSDTQNDSINLYCKEIIDITIEKIRSIIAYKLWKYIVKDINLIKIFDLFKDIYLLNNGDFYDYFLDKSWSLMHTPPNSKNEILLKILAWKSSCVSVEDYCKSKYENKKDKLLLEKYEDALFTECTNDENEYNFFNSSNRFHFDADNSENIISKYFYPRISYKKFSYDSFEREKHDNLILGGMSYIYDKKIVLNDFFRGIQTLYKKKYYDYDNIFSVCINNYRQQILRGFKHGFDFSVNFNNFFDNQFVHNENKEVNVEGVGVKSDNTNQIQNGDNFLVGCCFALVIHSMKNPLLYKTDVLSRSLGYWGSLGDCLSVEIKVKFYEKKTSEQDKMSQLSINASIEYGNNLNSVILGDVEIEVSLYIGGKGISSFVHNSNSYTVDYTKESILNNKLLADNINQEKIWIYENMKKDENYFKKRNINNVNIIDQDNLTNGTPQGNSNNNNDKETTLPVLKIQSNKQIFHDINKNTLTKFRVRINCLKHSFSVYIQKLDEYNINLNTPKNKIKPIIHIRALDMTQAFTLDIGNGYIGFYTCPILFKHKLLKKKSKLNEWFKRFYSDTLSADSTIYQDFFNMGNEKNKEAIQNELKNINKIILYSKQEKKKSTNGSDDCGGTSRDLSKNVLLFSSHDCSVEIYKWFHQSYKSPIEIPEVDVDNETLIFYDKQINKNIKIHSGLNLWNNVEIHFKLTWPIALIINTNTIYTYNSIFQFLFLLGRIYYNLKILCYHNRHLYKYLNYKKGALLFSYLFSIRYKMQFFFFHLIKYLQEDIINYEYRQMITQIHKSKDFEYTKSIHDLYISQVATKCFLRVQDITIPLMELIDISFKFCYFFQCLIENELFTDILNYEINEEEDRKKGDINKNVGNDSTDENINENDNDLNQVIEKLLQYNDIFNEKLACVLNEMVNVSANSNHAYLVHLLTIIDFNNYITKIKDSIIGKSKGVGENSEDERSSKNIIAKGEEYKNENEHVNEYENKNEDVNEYENKNEDGNEYENKNEYENEYENKNVWPRDKRAEKGAITGRNNIHFSKRDDNKMEYTDIENMNISDNYYVDKRDIYSGNLQNGNNISITGMSHNISEINELGNRNNNFLKKRIVNKFSNLIYNNNSDEKEYQHGDGINEHDQNNISVQSNKNILNGNVNVAYEDSSFRRYSNIDNYDNNYQSNINYNSVYNDIIYNDASYNRSHQTNSIYNDSNNNNNSYNSYNGYSSYNSHNKYNNYNILIDKYSNILNSYMNNSNNSNNNSNSVYNSIKSYSNNSHMDSYNSVLDASKLKHINHISNIPNENNNVNNFSMYNIEIGLNNNILNQENNITGKINNMKLKMDLNDNKSTFDQNPLGINNKDTENNKGNNNNATTNLNSLIDLNLKKNFNVQNLIDNYNYNYDISSTNNSFHPYNMDKYKSSNNNKSQLYNIPNMSNYGNIPLNIYQNENNISEMEGDIDREKHKHNK